MLQWYLVNFNWQLERYCQGEDINADLVVMLIKEGKAAIFLQIIWIVIQARAEVLPFISSWQIVQSLQKWMIAAKRRSGVFSS